MFMLTNDPSPSLPRPQSRHTPLFLRQAFLAYAIAADDNALLEATRSAAWDPTTKYDQGTVRLLVLRHLAKVRFFLFVETRAEY